MTSVTRSKLLTCKVKDCEFDEDTHQRGAWCRGIPGVEHAPGFTHQHWPKRSQGGRKVVALLCSFCHDRIDNGDWSNKVTEGVYLVWNTDHEILIRRNGSVSEPETLEGAGSAVARSSGSDSVPLKEEQDGHSVLADELRGAGAQHGANDGLHRGRADERHGAASLDSRVPDVSGSLSGPYLADAELTRAECIRLAQQLRAERERNPWMTGDLLNAAEKIDDPCNSWDGRTGESLLDIMRLQPETAANYARVAGAYSTTERVQGLTFGHHQSCYRLVDRDSWLKLALDEGLSVSELRRRIKPPQPKPKRWTVAELLLALGQCEMDENRMDITAEDFLEWLGQEQPMTSGLGGPG